MPYDNHSKYTQLIMVIGIHLNFYLDCISIQHLSQCMCRAPKVQKEYLSTLPKKHQRLYFCLEFKVSDKCSNANFCSTSSHAKFRNWQQPRDRCERLAQWEQSVLIGRRSALGGTAKHTQGHLFSGSCEPQKRGSVRALGCLHSRSHQFCSMHDTYRYFYLAECEKEF